MLGMLVIADAKPRDTLYGGRLAVVLQQRKHTSCDRLALQLNETMNF